MQIFQNKKHGCQLLVLSLLFIGGQAAASGVSARFSKQLSQQGSVEIAQKPEYCQSTVRPLTIAQELSAMLVHAVQYSEQIRVKTECQKVAGEKMKFCHFFFYSPKKSEPWSVGLNFLGDPVSGEIKLDTVACFSTP